MQRAREVAVRRLVWLAILLLAACAAPRREAPRVPPSIDYDRYTGSCGQWQQYISSHGVQDCNGKSHPGWFGATRCMIASSGYTFTPYREKGWFGRTCFSVELPRNPAQFRLVQSCTRIVDWVPATPINGACRAQRQDWLDRILLHEKQHIGQCESEVAKANQRWAQRSHKFSSCAFSERAAFKDLNEAIQAELEAEQQRVMDDIDRQFDGFHQTPAGQAVVTDCAPCQ